MRSASLLAMSLFVVAFPARAADPKAIDAAVRSGAEYLEGRYKDLKRAGEDGAEGVGHAAISGLALLESGKPADNVAVKAIAATMREASFGETRTYQLALALLFLDRLGEKADEPLIQLLAVRLLAGQNGNGGWTYASIESVPKAEEQRLRAKLGTNQLVAGGKGAGTEPVPMPPAKDAPPHLGVAGRLHPEVERHRQGLLFQDRNRIALPDDNSNTQFAILAVWVARKHGVPVEAALESLEKRFLASQTKTGGWPYSGLLDHEGSASMTCAGLLGLATAVGRREERRLKAEVPRKAETPKPMPEVKHAPDDPFFTPPPKPVDPPKKLPAAPKVGGDARDKAIERALENLAGAVQGNRAGEGRNPFRRAGKLGDRDLYFLWSLERVGVVYGLDKIGNVDWYQSGADLVVPQQKADGSWGGGYGADVDTSFVLLFLARSNLVRDLSAKVQRDPRNSELRGGPSVSPEPNASPSPMPEARPKPDPIATLPKPTPALPTVVEPLKPRPVVGDDESAKLADALLRVPAAAWAKSLEQVRDGKGVNFTQALVLAIPQVDGDRKKAVRGALAERLTRMSPETLRGMLKGGDLELRRAAVLACAMKDDRTHVPDLIDRLTDEEDIVVRAARAGLKSLSGGQDFGPDLGSTKLDVAIAVEEWKAWWAKQKK